MRAIVHIEQRKGIQKIHPGLTKNVILSWCSQIPVRYPESQKYMWKSERRNDLCWCPVYLERIYLMILWISRLTASGTEKIRCMGNMQKIWWKPMCGKPMTLKNWISTFPDSKKMRSLPSWKMVIWPYPLPRDWIKINRIRKATISAGNVTLAPWAGVFTSATASRRMRSKPNLKTVFCNFPFPKRMQKPLNSRNIFPSKADPSRRHILPPVRKLT